MNRRGNHHGQFGVRKRKGNLARPYYGRICFRGERIDTKPYATRDQAALATAILDAALHLASQLPSQLSGGKND